MSVHFKLRPMLVIDVSDGQKLRCWPKFARDLASEIRLAARHDKSESPELLEVRQTVCRAGSDIRLDFRAGVFYTMEPKEALNLADDIEIFADRLFRIAEEMEDRVRRREAKTG